MLAPKRILVPVDFTSCCAAALEYAATLARCLDASIEVLHVWQPPTIIPLDGTVLPPIAAFAETRAGQEMKRFLSKLESWGVPTDSISGRIAHGHPAEVIVRSADEGDIDLIVMGRNGRGRLHRLFLGSVAEQVSRTATCPVVTLHSPDWVAQHAVAPTQEEARS